MNLQNFKDSCDLICGTDESPRVKLKKLGVLFRKFIGFLESNFDTIPREVQAGLEAMAKYYRREALKTSDLPPRRRTGYATKAEVDRAPWLSKNQPLPMSSAQFKALVQEVHKAVHDAVAFRMQAHEELKRDIENLEQKAAHIQVSHRPADEQQREYRWQDYHVQPPGVFY